MVQTKQRSMHCSQLIAKRTFATDLYHPLLTSDHRFAWLTTSSFPGLSEETAVLAASMVTLVAPRTGVAPLPLSTEQFHAPLHEEPEAPSAELRHHSVS